MLKWLFSYLLFPIRDGNYVFFSLNYCLMGGNFCQAFYTSVFTHQVVFFFNYLALLIFVVLLAYLFFPAGGIPLRLV